MPENGYDSSKLCSQGVIKSLLFISQVSKDILNDAIFIWIFNDTINNSVSRVFFLPGRCRTYVVLLTMYYIVMKNRITSSQFAEQVGYKYFNSHRFWTVYSKYPPHAKANISFIKWKEGQDTATLFYYPGNFSKSLSHIPYQYYIIWPLCRKRIYTRVWRGCVQWHINRSFNCQSITHL